MKYFFKSTYLINKTKKLFCRKLTNFNGKGECTLRELHHEDISYAIGVDIGGTKVFIAIADDDGKVIFREKVKTSPDVQEIINALDGFLQKMNIPRRKIRGIGVGVPGVVNSEEGIVMDSPSLQWFHLNLKDIFYQHFGVPVVIQNDVNQALLGERYFGGNNSDNIFYVAIGTGVGSAIVANGRIIEGTHYSAGEVGYFIDRNDVTPGKVNNRLEFGTFERKTSGTALTQKGLEFGYSPQELFDQFRNNNSQVRPLIEDFTIELSIMIANVVSLLNPELVLIGGGVALSLDCIIDKIREHVANFTPIATQIELSKLGGEAGALGGIACFCKQRNQKMEVLK
jgi:glucokinase